MNGPELTISVGAETLRAMRAAVERGEYGSLAEVVADALGQWHRDHDRGTASAAALRRAVEESIDSGPALDADAVFDRLRTRFRVPPAA